MQRIQEIIRLSLCQGLSQIKIALSCGVSQSSVSKYINLAEQKRLTASEVQELDLNALAGRLGLLVDQPTRLSPLPDFGYLHGELKKKGVTLQLLWKEYKSVNPDGYQYSQFCDYYRRWKRKLHPTLRQEHHAGEKLFVDYAGQTMPIQDRHTGQICHAQIFVAVLGASNYTYAEATLSQGLPDWIASHIRTFFSLNELNSAISELLESFNKRAFKKLPGSRRSWFNEIDRPALKTLPPNRFVFAQWKWATVNIDYHIELCKHYYSVPFNFVRQKVVESQ